MALAVEVLNLATTIVAPDQIGWVLFAKNQESLVELVLFDVAMGRKVATGAVFCDKVSAG